MSIRKNIVITGIPRSGTAMLTAMIDGMGDAVALNEPRWQYNWIVEHSGRYKAVDFARWLVTDFEETRRKLLAGIPIPERRLSDGTAVTNYYRREEKLPPEHNFQLIEFTRAGLTPDFTLAIKHNGTYLSALRNIIETDAFSVIGILRHPVGVIASWNNVPIQLGQGNMPGAVTYWKPMRDLAQTPMDLLEKQVRIYDLVCKRFYTLRDRMQIVTYESIMEDLSVMSRILGRDMSFFASRIKPRELDFYGDTAPIEEAVKRYGHYYKHFYTEL